MAEPLQPQPRLDEGLQISRSELILGGQKSGKSRRAESLAGRWLAMEASHKAVLIATAQAHDDEMRGRIARHQSDRALRVPGLHTLEEPLRVAEMLQAQSSPDTLIVVDCLTLWLTNMLMPLQPAHAQSMSHIEELALVLEAVQKSSGPVVLVGNEIGLGIIPLGREVRAFVDALGLLNQSMAQICERVTLMVAGLPLALKGRA